MCVYLYAPMCTCAYMCVYIYVEYASIHTTSIHIYLNVCTCTNNIHTHTCVRTYISVYMHVCVFAFYTQVCAHVLYFHVPVCV